MRRFTALLFLILIAALFAVALPQGTGPRKAAPRYPSHIEVEGGEVGAALLTLEQMRKSFVTDIDRCCVVVEIAIYPTGKNTLEISWDQFTLRVPETDIAAKPSSPELLAAKLQKTAPTKRQVSVYPTVGIGYEKGPRGHDQPTGRTSRGGVYTSVGVGVGVGTTRPGSTEEDRATMELELSEKGLPEGAVSVPVAGFLYFSLPEAKDKKTFELEYALENETVVLKLTVADSHEENQ